MAESGSTKRTLAQALKTLTRKTPLDRISVTDICKECGVNRKSFYYHFQDKYALVNWIFDSEFGAVAADPGQGAGLHTMLVLLEYLYENRSFYRRALQVKGQNSFSEHFRELLVTSVKTRLRGVISSEALEFRIGFYADAFIATIERWLLGRESMPPTKLFGLITSCLEAPGDLQKALG